MTEDQRWYLQQRVESIFAKLENKFWDKAIGVKPEPPVHQLKSVKLEEFCGLIKNGRLVPRADKIACCTDFSSDCSYVSCKDFELVLTPAEKKAQAVYIKAVEQYNQSERDALEKLKAFKLKLAEKKNELFDKIILGGAIGVDELLKELATMDV